MRSQKNHCPNDKVCCALSQEGMLVDLKRLAAHKCELWNAESDALLTDKTIRLSILPAAMFTRSFLLILLVSATSVYARCSPMALRKCYNSYLENFKVSTSRFPSYRSYDNAKHSYLNATGLPAQMNICRWQTQFEKCLGTAIYSCMSTAALQTKLGISRHEAVSYNTDFYAMNYKCGNGYSDLKKHFFCLRSVPKLYSGEIEMCSRTLDQAIDDPYECSYYNDFINCVRRIYTNECGQGVSKYVCNYEKVAMTANTHRCSDSLLIC
ncbi:hypothetical protein QR680_003660 [Steinernema hermaphroditum]|uniref:DUF19 domain-containing protein n=1 Tax=Steinernema hermaphroditum TaxID=289476 RepID=A0AA39LSM7_9BILA|nr:hypothetical protein QR680_003660 [Steinernema hermaphroditum]